MLHLCVTAGHTLTSALLALIRTSQTSAPPTWSGAHPLQPTVPLEDPAWGPQDPCPCCLRWFFGSVTGQEASLPPFSQKTLQGSGWGGGGGREAGSLLICLFYDHAAAKLCKVEFRVAGTQGPLDFQACFFLFFFFSLPHCPAPAWKVRSAFLTPRALSRPFYTYLFI